MNHDLLLRARIALVALVVAALAPLGASLGTITTYLRSPPLGADWITRHEQHLAHARAALLALGVKRVGYLPRTTLRAGSTPVTADAHFLATRYALAPIMLFPDARQTLVFADLAVEPDPSGGIPPDFSVVSRFDGGLVLLQRRPE